MIATLSPKKFQFTPLREGRHPRFSRHTRLSHFNSRPSARGDAATNHGSCFPSSFQFTPLREGRRAHGGYIGHRGTISIHAPPRGATLRLLFFQAHRYISIHAPPRGATALRTRRDACERISIHAPPRGATRWLYTQPSFSRHFNSRPSARGDVSFSAFCVGLKISIHAPPRGATLFLRSEKLGEHISIHAPPRGATDYGIRVGGAFSFQFTPLREGRQQEKYGRKPREKISIHAPPRGATLLGEQVGGRQEDFNSRPSARGDFNRRKSRQSKCISIHAPPRGATSRRKGILSR